MPSQRRIGGTAQRVRQRGGGAWAIDAIGRTGRRVGGNCHRRLPAQDIRANAGLGQDLGCGGNVRQGVQEVVEPHIRGAVELRYIVGAVAACQHQLVNRDRIGLARARPHASPKPRSADPWASRDGVAPAARKFRSPPLYAMVSISRSAGTQEEQGNSGAACHCVVVDIGKLLPVQ